MRRFQFFEFCDQPWISGWMREGFMDCLSVLYAVSKPYKPYKTEFRTIAKQGPICNLATGAGESIKFFLEDLKNNPPQKPIKIIGSDLYPNVEAYKRLKEEYPFFDYSAEPVNAFNAQAEENTAYTIFTAFHHFKPIDAAHVIRNCLSNAESLTIFELSTRHNIFNFLILPISFLGGMLTPFLIRKYDWRIILCSTILPIIPFMYTWDGMVSNFRSYTKEELKELANSAMHGRKVKLEYTERHFSLFFKSYMCRFYLEK